MAGELNVEKVARSLTAKQFRGWELFNAIEPFDQRRDDWRAASIRQMIFNMAVNVKDRKPMGDFVLQFDTKDDAKKPGGQSWQEKKAIGMAIAAAYAAPRGPVKRDTTAEASAMADAVLAGFNAKL